METIIPLLEEGARRIWCYRWLALAVMIVTFAAGAAYVWRLPDVYEAWGQVFVSRQTPISAATEGVSLVGPGYGSPYFVQKTLLNDQNLERVVRLRNPAAAGYDTATMAGAVARLRGHTRIADQGDGFVEFYFTDTDPVRARDTAQLLMDQYIEQNIKRSQKDLGETQGFLDDQIDAYGRMLADNETQLTELERQYPGLLMATAATTSPQTATAEPPGAPAEAAAAGPRPPQSPPKHSAAQDLVTSLEAKLASLRTVYTDQYPDVIATRRQLAQAKAELALEPSLPDEGATSPSAAGAAGGPTRRRSALAPRLPAAPSPIVAKWSDLRRNQDVLRADYQQLFNRRQGTRMSQAVYANDKSGKYQVTRRPTTPMGPTGNKRPLYLALAAVAATAAGLGSAYLMAGLKGILVTPRELEHAFQLPVVGTVALERAWETRRPRRLRLKQRRAARRSAPREQTS